MHLVICNSQNFHPWHWSDSYHRRLSSVSRTIFVEFRAAFTPFHFYLYSDIYFSITGHALEHVNCLANSSNTTKFDLPLYRSAHQCHSDGTRIAMSQRCSRFAAGARLTRAVYNCVPGIQTPKSDVIARPSSSR